MKEIGEDTERAHKPGIDARIDDNLTVRGWDGKPDQRGGAIFANQATFHPTRYVNGVLKWLQNQSNFSCYTGTSVILLDEKGIEMLGLGQKYCEVKTESGNTVVGGNAVGTLWERCGNDKCAFAETQCHRSDGMESDIECDNKDDYTIVGGGDHNVGQEAPGGRFENLEKWTRERFEDLSAGSGGILNPKASKPVAVYKDKNGHVTTMTAFYPHMKGVVCWNGVGKS